MNFNQFYENIILRDVIEYFTPGANFLAGLYRVIVSFFTRLGLHPSLFDINSLNSFPLLGMAILIAYAFGHLLTGVSSTFFRKAENQQATEVLKKDKWLKAQVAKVASKYLGESESKTSELLDNPSMASTIREIGRTIIQHKMPAVHKEFVVRLSILSRFCQNMSIAIGGVLISCLLTTIINWNDIQKIIRPVQAEALLTTGFIFGLGILGVYLFARRAVSLRRNMIKFTFQIWYISFLETEPKGNNKRTNKPPSPKS
jgi:hypothetical protein